MHHNLGEEKVKVRKLRHVLRLFPNQSSSTGQPSYHGILWITHYILFPFERKQAIYQEQKLLEQVTNLIRG